MHLPKINNKGFAPLVIVVIAATILSATALLANNTLRTNTISDFVKPSIKSPSPSVILTATQSAIPSVTPTATPSATLAPTPKAPITPKPTVISTPTPSPQPVVTNNTPPGSGFSRQTVSVDGQNFTVAIVAADLNSTKVIVDTASDSDCKDSCPVLSLGDYVARNGAWAGINGSYFCPAEYPSCAGKTNSFDTLVMNKNKHYFNSDNNVYSTVPAVIFSPGSYRFVGRSLEWGRDTGVDAVIANYPQLLAGGNISFTEAPNEPKFGGKAPRTFIAAKYNMVYIGIVYGASMADSAKVLQAMGMNEALNLDQGGSTALWHGGYKAGPGRSIPNAILFVNR